MRNNQKHNKNFVSFIFLSFKMVSLAYIKKLLWYWLNKWLDIDIKIKRSLHKIQLRVNSNKYTKPSFYYFSIHSLSVGPIHYRITWEAKGVPPRNGFASKIDTKEVILGQSDSGSGGSGISFIGVSSSTQIKAQQEFIPILFISSVLFLQISSPLMFIF